MNKNLNKQLQHLVITEDLLTIMAMQEAILITNMVPLVIIEVAMAIIAAIYMINI